MELSAKLVRSQLNFFKPFVAGCSLEVTRKGQDKLGELMTAIHKREVYVREHDFGGFQGAWLTPKDKRRTGVVLYLHGGGYKEIAHTVVNALAINSGMLCDGAKASCAAKIASAVEAGLLGLQMYRHDSQFYGGDGIIVKGVENTIRAVSSIARDGMRETDNEIIRLMIGEDAKK